MSRRGDGYGFVRLPVEEHVVKCTVDGDRVSPSWMAEAGERVVRCRDCGLSGTDVNGGLTCGRWPESVHATEPDGFCKWGKRDVAA